MNRQATNALARLGLTLLLGQLGCAVALAGGNPAEGARKSLYCTGCHGPDGNETRLGTPRLAGQSEALFLQQMHAYKADQRSTHPMQAMLTDGMDPQDIADIGAFYASRKVAPARSRR